MRNSLCGLAAATLFSTAAMAAEGSWMELDTQISSLVTTATASSSEGGADVSGYIKSYYNSDSDADLGGWKFSAIRLNVKATVEDMKVKVSFDMKGGSAVLKDAYIKWNASEAFDVTIGQFKRPFLWSFTRSGSRLLFIKETASADNESRDNGVQLHGGLGELGEWFLAATNGDDGATDENYYTARVQFDVLGDGAFNKHEGAIDGKESAHASVGISYAEESGAGAEGDKLALEAAMTMDNLFLHLETVQHDDAFAGTDDSIGSALADTTPVSITASYLVRDDVELAIRVEDFDDADDSSRTKIAVNYYSVLPHKMKWQLNYSDTSSDDSSKESELVQLGFTIAF